MPRKAAASTSTPRPQRVTRSRAEVVEALPAAGEGPDAEGAVDHAAPGAAEAGAEPGKTESAAVATPARKGGKRKAGGHEDETPDSSRSTSNKKAKVQVQETESVSESGGRKHAHRSVRVEIPVSTPTTKPSGKHIVFDNNDDDDNDNDGPSQFFTPQEGSARKALEAQLPKAGDDDEDQEGEDESDSEDDAPEAVSSHAAAASAAKSAQAAAKAAEKYVLATSTFLFICFGSLFLPHFLV